MELQCEEESQYSQKHDRERARVEVQSAGKSYPSSDRLQDAGQGVVLELEKLRRLTVHLETIGVVVEFHRTHKVTPAGHHIGELGGEQASVTLQSHRWPEALILRSAVASQSNDNRDKPQHCCQM